MKNPQASSRLQELPASPIRKLVPFANRAKQEGVKVYHLNIGDPDIQTPEVMLQALKDWDKNPIGYGQSQGDSQYLQAFVRYYHKLGATFIQEKNIQATVGGSEAIAMAMFATCVAGDELLVFEPFYTNYNSYAALFSVTLVPVTTTIDTGFHLPQESEIQKKISNRTKGILICNPNNPTGTVYTKDEIEMLVRIAKKNGLFLLSDEVYREYCFSGKKHISLLSYMREIPNHAIVLDSVSKRYSLCGVRLGALVSLNEQITSGVLKIAQGRLSAGIVDSYIASKMDEVPDSYCKNVQIEYEARRDELLTALHTIPGVVAPKPDGAFYAIAKLPVRDSEAFCQWLLTDFRDNNETVMLAPLAGFYKSAHLGHDEVRIAYVLSREKLIRAIELVKIALRKYRE